MYSQGHLYQLLINPPLVLQPLCRHKLALGGVPQNRVAPFSAFTDISRVDSTVHGAIHHAENQTAIHDLLPLYVIGAILEME